MNVWRGRAWRVAGPVLLSCVLHAALILPFLVRAAGMGGGGGGGGVYVVTLVGAGSPGGLGLGPAREPVAGNPAGREGALVRHGAVLPETEPVPDAAEPVPNAAEPVRSRVSKPRPAPRATPPEPAPEPRDPAQADTPPNPPPRAVAALGAPGGAGHDSGGGPDGPGAAVPGGLGGGSGGGAGGGIGPGAGSGAGPGSGAPVLVRYVEPEYPARARRRGISGQVTVTFFVTPQGQVRDPRIVIAHPEGYFEQSVLDAVPRWRFDPAMDHGRPTGIWMSLPVRFDLRSP